MKLYLFGPMRGLPDWNFPAFDRARATLQNLGHEVFCPALMTRALPYQLKPDMPRSYLAHVIAQDLLAIHHAEALAGLSGWERSTGATVEVAMAEFLGLPIFCALTFKELDLPRPWGFTDKRAVDFKLDGQRLDRWPLSNGPRECWRCLGSRQVKKTLHFPDKARELTIHCPICNPPLNCRHVTKDHLGSCLSCGLGPTDVEPVCHTCRGDRRIPQHDTMIPCLNCVS